MSNQNYSEHASRRANKNKGAGGYKYHKGSYGAEHDGPQKDTPTKWPKAPGQRSPSLNRAGFPIVKSSVVNDGIDQ